MADQSRAYQSEGINSIREVFRRGLRKVLLWLATGGGKTWIFCKMIKDASERGRHALIVVRGRKLVDQASKRLFKEHVLHGVLMASHWNFRPHLPIQVCSIDTLISRKLRPKADLIVIDEAHLATSPGYKEFLADYPDAFIVSVTATPYVKGGMRHIADEIVHPISMLELMDTGFLVRFKYFAPSKPDLSKVKISRLTNDYVQDELEETMIESDLDGNVVEHWKLLGKNRPTIGFGVSIEHCRIMSEKFNKVGISSEYLDKDTPESEREEVLKRSQDGTTKIVWNVRVLSTGVDMPWIGAIIDTAPTISKNLFIQKAGRGTRPFYADGFDLDTVEGRLAAIAASVKPDCIYLDHAGNLGDEGGHGFPTDEPDVDLDGKIKESYKMKSKRCKKCFVVYRGQVCPDCGSEEIEVPKVVALTESEKMLIEIEAETDPMKRELVKLHYEAKKKKRKPAWAFHKLVNKFGYNECAHLLPDWFIQSYERKQAGFFNGSRFRGYSGS